MKKSRRLKQIAFASFLFIAAAFVATELWLRVVYGLGTPPLFEADEYIGYYYKANQSLYRMGNHFFANEYHQRSDPLMENPDYRILMVGDSVTNGGVWTNQNETITEILEKKLNDYYSVKGEVLNAAAESWGIENEFEYVKKFGIFNSDLVILQIGSQDLVQPKSLSNSLGTLEKPTTNPICAIHEALQLKLLKNHEVYSTLPDAEYYIQDNINRNFAKQIIEIIEKNNKSVIILMTPNKNEIGQESSYQELKDVFFEFLESLNISHVNLLDYELGQENYQDGVHFNKYGNQFVANILFEYILEQELILEND
jgi:lysophospholipase L1-like esterase